MSGRAVIRTLAVLLTLAVLVAAGYLALPHPAQAAEEPAAKGPSLHDTMEQMNSAFRRLRRQIRKPDKAVSSLELIATMQAKVVTAKALAPKQITAMPKDKQAAALKSYRLQMVAVLGELVAAEKAVLEARYDDAYEHARKMNTLKGECHEKMKVDE